LDYDAEHWINQLMRHHPLMGQAVIQFSTWGVTVFGVVAVGLWLLSPAGDTRWKRACASGLAAGALGLGINQLISHIWDRARPYDAHHAIVPLLTRSADPSFPSDHATAAFSIAFGIFFVARRAGWLFLAAATLIAVSRVLAGMHYPTDVAASFVVSITSGYLVARFAMKPILLPLIGLLSRVTDPVLVRVASLAAIRRTVLDPRVRGWVALAVGAVILLRIEHVERSHLIDELPLLLVAAWVGVAALAVRLARTRYWPAASAHRDVVHPSA
jgi:undecaprenyl-diphosphatase